MSDSSSPITIRNFNFEELLSDTPIGSGPDYLTLDTVGVGAAPVPSPRPSSRASMIGGPSGVPARASPFPSVGQISSAASGLSDVGSNRSSVGGGPVRRRRVLTRRARDGRRVVGGSGRRGRGGGRGGRGGRGGGRGRGGGGGGGGGGGSGGGGGGGGSESTEEDDDDDETTDSDVATRVRRDRRIRDLRQELQALLNDAGQAAKGRHIEGITTTQTITTTYKNRKPSVQRTSTYSSA